MKLNLKPVLISKTKKKRIEREQNPYLFRKKNVFILEIKMHLKRKYVSLKFESTSLSDKWNK